MDDSFGFTAFLFSFWWLVFPLAAFIGAGWSSWMKFRRHKANLDLLKTYAKSGNEPPANLLDALNREPASEDADESGHRGEGKGAGSAFLVILFAGLAGVFAYVAYTGMLGIEEEGYFIALILGVLALAFLGSAMFGSSAKSD